MTTRVVDPHIIKSAMKAAGINSSKLAEATNLINSKISLILSGHRTVSLHELIAIAGVLNVPWTSLLPAVGISDPTRPLDVACDRAAIVHTIEVLVEILDARK